MKVRGGVCEVQCVQNAFLRDDGDSDGGGIIFFLILAGQDRGGQFVMMHGLSAMERTMILTF